MLELFFNEWDAVERMHPWGVVAFTPFFLGHGVSPALCEEVDEFLFIDLMLSHRSDMRFIKVEGRFSQMVFWVVVIIRYPMAILGFQLNPVSPLLRSVVVSATPGLVVACILAFYRWAIGSCSGRCGGRMLVAKCVRMVQ